MHVAIVGSGPVGMTTALLLARQGHGITLIDRDPGPVPGQAWERSGVMQFHLPHGFRAQVRNLLAERLPDVLQAELDAGARIDEIPPGAPPSAAGLLVRRSVFERTLWEVTSREPGVRRLTGHVESVEVVEGAARGVVVDAAVVRADLVVDASGRAGRATSEHRPRADRTDCQMAYAARLYRLRPGAEPGPLSGGSVFFAAHDGFLTLVFPHDARTFTVLFIRASDDRALAQLRHAAAFEAACRVAPGVDIWTDPLRSESIDEVRAGAGLTNEFRRQPPVARLVLVGDALCVTNPMGARGMLLGLHSAAALVDLLAKVPLQEVPTRLDEWADQQLRPWFDDHVRWDASMLRAWSGHPVDPDGPIGPEVLQSAAAELRPDWQPMLGRYLGMTITPDQLEPLRTETRQLVRDGWQPAPVGGLSRSDLAAVIDSALQPNAEIPVSA